MKQSRSAARQDSEMKKSSRISFAEIAFVVGYFILVFVIPSGWIDSAVGEIAFTVASKVNPYLSEYSIAFSQHPQYFIHCHVLATWLLAPTLFGFVISRNGGLRAYEDLFMQSVSQQSLLGKWLLYLFILAMVNGMLWIVDYPLSGAERAIWEYPFGVSFYAFAVGGLLSALGYGFYFLLKATFVEAFKGTKK
jgi:uncharacterized integral membrane protein